MKKLGFTLAEVLITLTIIGVIAAITIPALMHSMDKTHYMSGLKTFQSNFTNGFAEMMATEMVDSLRDASPWNCLNGSILVTADTCVYKAMKNHFALSDQMDNVPEGIVIHDIAGNAMNNAFEETIRYTLPNNMTVNMNYMNTDKTREECETIKNNGGSLCGIAANIFVDVNGNKRPNIIGKDIYRFVLGPNGKLYPYGGKDWALYNGSADWKTTCAGKPLPETCVQDTSYDLTGRVIEEGYQINYY